MICLNSSVIFSVIRQSSKYYNSFSVMVFYIGMNGRWNVIIFGLYVNLGLSYDRLNSICFMYLASSNLRELNFISLRFNTTFQKHLQSYEYYPYQNDIIVYESENTIPLNPAITLLAPFARRRAVQPSFSTALPLLYNYFLPDILSKNRDVCESPVVKFSVMNPQYSTFGENFG